MNTSISIRLFVGLLMTKELRFHLSQNKLWKNFLEFESELLQITHEGEDYIGYSLEESISLSNVFLSDAKIKKAVQPYCPKFNLDNLSVTIFPQHYVS